MTGPANPYKITTTRPGSTASLGYRSLSDYTGPVTRQPPAPPGTSQPTAFAQGVADAVDGQHHHVLRSMVVGYVVGAVVGHAVARMRHR
jgi:hypothetical protein